MANESVTPRTIADRHLDQVAAHDPMTSAWLGLNPGDDRQPDLSPDGFEAHAELARRSLAALDAAPVPGDPAEQACARLLRERLTAELAMHDTGENYRQLRTVGAHVEQVRSIFTLMPTTTDEDWAAVVEAGCATSPGHWTATGAPSPRAYPAACSLLPGRPPG